MTRTATLRIVLWVCAVIATGQSTAAADTSSLSGRLLLLAAASTTEAVDDARAEFGKLHPGVTIRVSYGASSTLAQQIAAGADADLFLSASGQWAEFLQGKQLVARGRDLFGNRLVIVTAADSNIEVKQPDDLLQPRFRRLAMADPKSVPAGVYGRQALETLGLWKQLEAKVAAAADVRQALNFVDVGAAEAGIVYATDAATDKKVRTALVFDAKLHEPIRYPLVLLKHGADRAAAVALYDFLGSPAAAAIFRRHGFVVPAAPDRPKP